MIVDIDTLKHGHLYIMRYVYGTLNNNKDILIRLLFSYTHAIVYNTIACPSYTFPTPVIVPDINTNKDKIVILKEVSVEDLPLYINWFHNIHFDKVLQSL